MIHTPEQPPIIRAFHTLDCARKVRVHYFMPVPIDEALLEMFDDARVERQLFSKFVGGAKDHFTVSGADYHAAGVLGEHRLVVTFAKLEPDEHPARLDLFEERLRRATNGAPVLRSEAEQRPA